MPVFGLTVKTDIPRAEDWLIKHSRCDTLACATSACMDDQMIVQVLDLTGRLHMSIKPYICSQVCSGINTLHCIFTHYRTLVCTWQVS